MTENNKYKQIIELNPITAIEYSSCQQIVYFMIDKSKIEVGKRLKIWSSKYNCEKGITIVFKRLSVIFFLYDNDVDEDWLPTGSYIVEKAEFV